MLTESEIVVAGDGNWDDGAQSADRKAEWRYGAELAAARINTAAAATLRGAFSAYLGVSGGPPCALHHLSMPHAATSSPRPALLPAASSRSLSAPSERHDAHRVSSANC